MGLEKLVDIAYKASLPVRVIDNTIKWGVDAITTATAKVGYDRYRLAKYASIGVGIASAVIAVDAAVMQDYKNTAIYGLVSLIYFTRTKSNADRMRTYSPQPGDALNYELELARKAFKFIRYTGIAFLTAKLIADSAGIKLPGLFINSLDEVGNKSSHFFLAFTLSYAYLIDGKHNLWDKSVIKAKKAWDFLANLTQKRSPTPEPAPSMNYNSVSAA